MVRGISEGVLEVAGGGAGHGQGAGGAYGGGRHAGGAQKLALKAHEEEVQAGGASGSAARPPRATADKAGIQWVRIPGGSFTMGYGGVRADEKPAHQVTVKSFELTKTLVTNKQYKACVAAGACLAAHVSDRNCYVSHGSNWDSGNLPDSFQSDDQPVVCVTWGQAKAYAQWVGEGCLARPSGSTRREALARTGNILGAMKT